MDEKNSMQYDCEPMEPAAPEKKTYSSYEPTERSGREHGYAPYENNVGGGKSRKDRTLLKIVALVAAVAIVASIGGAALTMVLQKVTDPGRESAAEASAQEQPVVTGDVPEAGSAYEIAVHKLPDTLARNEAGKSLTPTQVYEQTVNSVVGIRTESTVNAFGQEAVSATAGSGFILSTDGYVITNAHVVGTAETIMVDMFNGESYKAQLIGADSSFDIAVLKIDAADLPPVSVGDSDLLKVGEEVIAIGNPLGELTFTMTNGILSALDREINTDGNPQNMIQTNAAINSGNSGGPLFDMDGNVIGVTTAKYSGSTTSGTTIEGLGFAIPINTALKVAYDLAEYGYVRGQAYLGVTVRTLDTQTAQYYSLPAGPRVEAVNEGSCSDLAGLKAGDIIIRFDGTETASYTDLLSVLKKTSAGETVEVVVFRAGAELELTITLDEKPSQAELDAKTQQVQEELQRKQEDQQQNWNGQLPSQEVSPVNPEDFFRYFFGSGNGS